MIDEVLCVCCVEPVTVVVLNEYRSHMIDEVLCVLNEYRSHMIDEVLCVCCVEPVTVVAC